MDSAAATSSSAASSAEASSANNNSSINSNSNGTGRKGQNAKRGGGRHNNNSSNNNQQKSDSAATPKGKRQDGRNKKEKDTTNATTGSAPNPRAPRTIAATDPIDLQTGKEASADAENSVTTTTATAPTDDGAEHSCFICTENIVIFAVSDCNHRTCHLCSLRLRALYKTKNCAYCKADQGVMIFTRHPEKAFQDYNLTSMAYYDRKLNIYFEDQEMYEDTMVLLRFNCPDPTCEVACPEGWNQLKSHVKKVHKLMLCDLCVRHKKVFAHEHNLMTASQLMKHFKNGDSGQANQNSAEPSGFKGHPECGFCKESFYGDDELFEHCKKNHEQCFLCLRRNIRHQYYDKYPDLERHLHSEHYACMDPECLEKKFVVFDSDLDLKGHEAEMHPNSTHGQRNRLRDARKIDISFNYQSASENSNARRGGRNNNNNNNNRQQGRNNNRESDVPAQPQLTPHQIQQIALQQQMAEEHERRQNSENAEAAREGLSDLSLDSAQQKSMLRTRPPAGFGATLSEPTPVRPQSSPTSAAARVAANIQRTSSPMRVNAPVVVSQSSSDWPAVSGAGSAVVNTLSPRPGPFTAAKAAAPVVGGSPVSADTLSKHSALQERVQQYLQGTSGSLSQFRTLTTQYRNSQIPGNQYVASLSALFGNDMDRTGKVIQGLYDVLDSESKKAEIMRVWRDFKTVQSQFPSLESTSAPTMADIATPSTRRVLVIKSSGTTRGGLGHTKPKSTSTWDRAAAAAASSSSPNRTSSPGGFRSTATPVFYPTPQLNSSSASAWTTPQASDDTYTEPVFTPVISKSTSSSQRNNNSSSNSNIAGLGGSASWAGISQTTTSSAPVPQFRPSTGNYSRPVTAADQFPSLVSQAPVGVKPSFGLLPMKKSRSQTGQDEPNGWVSGWNNLSAAADQDAEEESATGKKKKNKKKILFHVG
ncbi:hypothetical protein BGZ97_000884 [Linnemannia gamsii]|uniref:RING-type E3 ubiquitin transferase n=1 Tax=Linnemannia gamsii TaxID=64522 RepID=A0A9P6UJY5_9FUNG|nr:hypothetical protein BGZ97_000884 [Linnemannia gamsii]